MHDKEILMPLPSFSSLDWFRSETKHCPRPWPRGEKVSVNELHFKTCSSFSLSLVSLLTYLSSEVTRGYQLDHDEERYTTRREKMYTFMKIPRELEKFMSYGFFHCLDTFLFVFTFLPVRFGVAALAFFCRGPLIILGWVTDQKSFDFLGSGLAYV